MKIKFGTDGWRAIIAKEFTNYNVARITYGVAAWLKQNNVGHKVVIGFDCRFAGKQFMDVVSKVLLHEGIDAIIYNQPITTPAISLAAKELNCGLGVIITASHNPATYNGYKLKGAFGGPLLAKSIEEIEELIPDEISYDFEEFSNESAQEVDLKKLYLDNIHAAFDIEAIRNSGLNISYDAMYGSGQFIVRELFPDADLYRCEWNPTFYGINPEPILKNLGAYQKHVKETPSIDFGLVNDGDADRIGLFDGEGNYIDSHNIILLLLHYLHNYKGWSGKVATGFSSTVKITQFCKMHDLELEVVPIGFKHICGLMVNEDILLGGEESGGIAVKGHIPERDGIWNGLVLLQAMMETKKSLPELLNEVTKLVGEFSFQRIDLKLTEAKKHEVVRNCKVDKYTSFGDWKVERIENLDGWKYYFNEDEWLMIRPSGTEPVLRTYAEGKTKERAIAILESCHKEIL
ncbi:MAG: phosphoglucosamine mutase [Crocinitomicaceae bacterium]|nr:phosphoglucosamine mutase [Crocinitomicaceae bacterium]|tara:strand:+ start:6202 stop:7584 length:1383 start_codon:yes stop_codon:yes gene_type:complete